MSVFTKTINFSSHTGFILYSYSLLVWLHIRLNSWDSAKILRCLVIWFFSAALRPAFTTPRSVHWWHLPLTLGTKRHLKCMKLPSSKCMWGPLCSRQLNQDSSHCKDVSCTIHTHKISQPSTDGPEAPRNKFDQRIGRNSSAGNKRLTIGRARKGLSHCLPCRPSGPAQGHPCLSTQAKKRLFTSSPGVKIRINLLATSVTSPSDMCCKQALLLYRSQSPQCWLGFCSSSCCFLAEKRWSPYKFLNRE